MLVAHHAGVGRAAGLVFGGKIIDDVGLEILGLIDEIVANAEVVADGTGIGDGLRAAAFILHAGDAVLRPELERDTDDFVALLNQQRGRRGGIHPAAHPAKDARFFLFGDDVQLLLSALSAFFTLSTRMTSRPFLELVAVAQ